MKTAKYIDTLTDYKGQAELFHLEDVNQYVVVSAVTAYSGPETYIFPSNKKGEITSYLELSGSFQGALNIEEALRRAGYSNIVGRPNENGS